MAKWGHPQSDRPGYLVCMISNYAPNAGNPPPPGSHRRLCYLKLLNSHGDGALEAQADPLLKERIIAGMYVLDVFHLVRAFFPRLLDYTTWIQKPQCVKLDTAEALGAEQGESPMELWIAATFCPAVSIAAAADIKDIKQLWMDRCEMRKQQVEVPMKEHGFVCTRGGARRYVVYAFPPSLVVRPVGIKPRPVSESRLASAFSGASGLEDVAIDRVIHNIL